MYIVYTQMKYRVKISKRLISSIFFHTYYNHLHRKIPDIIIRISIFHCIFNCKYNRHYADYNKIFSLYIVMNINKN